MSHVRTMQGGWAHPEDLPKGAGGRALCRWCSLEVPAGRRTFCSDFCVHEWKLRSDPGYLRERVFERDRGVCALCGLDCHAEWNRMRRVPWGRRIVLLKEWGLKPRQRASLWDADHIIPVAEGGGECDLDNIRTLCLKCHRRITGELRERLRRMERPATSP